MPDVSGENPTPERPVIEGELDPKIWDNPTLGAATNSVFLDQLEKQQLENRSALIEERPAKIVKRENRYPGYVAENPNDPPVEFGSTYDDGSRVVPAIAPNEEGYVVGDGSAAKDSTGSSSTGRVSSSEKPSGKSASK